MPSGRGSLEKAFQPTAFLLSMLVALFCATVSNAQAGKGSFSNAIAAKAAAGRNYDIENWGFRLGAYSYVIDRTGRGRRQHGQSRPMSFRLQVPAGEDLVRIYYVQHKGDLLLLCEIESGGYGAGFISRFDGRTMRRKWNVTIPAFNISNGVIENNSVYLGAVGYASKLNLDSGKFVWKHDNFYRKYREDGAFNLFDPPRIVGNEVIYVENQSMYNKAPNVIRFNKNNGRVTKVELN